MVELPDGNNLALNCTHKRGEFRTKLECRAEEGEFIQIEHRDKHNQWSRSVWCENGLNDLAENMEENMRRTRDATSQGAFVDAVDDSQCHFIDAQTKVQAKRTGWQTDDKRYDLTPKDDDRRRRGR